MKMRLLALALSSILPSLALAAVPDRIVTPVDERSRTAIRGNVRDLAAAADQGAVEPTLLLPRITIHFNRTPAQEIELQRLRQQLQDPSSPSYHKWLTPQQYGERFGISEADLAKVRQWAESFGLKVVDQAQSRTYIAVSGTAAQARSAFGVELRRYRVGGEAHIANANAPSLPVAIANIVMGIRGFADFRPKPRGFRPHPKFTSSISGNHFITPDDFATFYDLKPLYNLGINGAGQWLVILGQTGILQGDIATFRSNSGLNANAPVVVPMPGSNDPTISNNDIGEADLDIEWAGAVARSATIIYVNAGTNSPNGVFDAMNYVINNQLTVGGNTQLAPVISVSYGDCEVHWQSAPAEFTTLQNDLQQASTQGQTVVGPSGDAGAADCEMFTSTSATTGLAVDFPASDPFVVGVGGTMFNEGNNASQFWAPANNSLNGSALSYIPETVWNETAANANVLAASGGGNSIVFPKPAYQTALTPADNARDVPDLSLAAAFIHDGFLVCTSNQTPPDCTSGFRDVNTNLDVVGGTSVGAPTFAGMVVLVNQMLSNQSPPNPPVGFLNPALYTLAATSIDAFHDITTGDNIVPCTQNSPNCPNSAPFQFGFSAGAGYDLATGLGTVDGYNLVSELATGTTSTPPAPDFALMLTTPASVTITHGTSGTATVSMQSLFGFSGNVTFSCIVPSSLAGVTCAPPAPASPPGNVDFTITASPTARLAQPGAGRKYLAWTGGGTAFLAGFLLIGAVDPRRRKKAIVMTSCTFLLMTLFLVGCGANSTPPPPPPMPHPESGIIVMQGTNNSTVHMVTLTVNIN